MTGLARVRGTVRELLDDEETRPVFLAALLVGGLAVGWGIGAVAAGEPVADQSLLVVVVGCVLTTIGALIEEDLEG